MAGISLREAGVADADLLLAWRNDPDTLVASGNPEPVAPDDHARWLGEVLRSPDRHLLMAEAVGEPVGQVRFDRRQHLYEISVSLARHARGRGMGGELISAGIDWLRERSPVELVVARVREGNDRSIRAFSSAGFAPSGRLPQPGFITLELGFPADAGE